MTVEELRAECARRKALGLKYVPLVVPRKREPRGCHPRIRVVPGVMGEMVGSQQSSRDPKMTDCIVMVLIADIERALAKESK